MFFGALKNIFTISVGGFEDSNASKTTWKKKWWRFQCSKHIMHDLWFIFVHIIVFKVVFTSLSTQFQPPLTFVGPGGIRLVPQILELFVSSGGDGCELLGVPKWRRLIVCNNKKKKQNQQQQQPTTNNLRRRRTTCQELGHMYNIYCILFTYIANIIFINTHWQTKI